MNKLVTLILILHNRHKNLDRQLAYYAGSSFPIIIADSSAEEHQFGNTSLKHQYLYTPGITFTKKIEQALKSVTTPYVVMCADDDFIIPEAIERCVEFLELNKDYTITQGTCINFKKSSLGAQNIDFGLVYPVRSYDIEMEEPLARLERMFEPYRSVLYAVHRTQTLQLAFKNSSEAIQNLYLNEYVTAVVPILSGKYKELTLLYQVREFAEGSDDKTTDNLDVLFADKRYETELKNFINLSTNNAAVVVTVDKEELRKKIFQTLERFSRSSQIGYRAPKITFKKKVGVMVKNLPVIGSWLVKKNRQMEKQYDLQKVIQTDADRQHLVQVETILKSFAKESNG